MKISDEKNRHSSTENRKAQETKLAKHSKILYTVIECSILFLRTPSGKDIGILSEVRRLTIDGM